MVQRGSPQERLLDIDNAISKIEILWETIKRDLPALKVAVGRLLAAG